MGVQSVPISFVCDGTELYGILCLPSVSARRAVLVVVGGPQYRVGSHRQFTLLSRFLASGGVPTMRFDHRGTGDSDGDTTFEDMDPDIRAAIDALISRQPEIEEVVIWGLCDGASAAMMYAPTDARVKGLVLLNPWVRNESTLARAQLKRTIASDFLNPQKWRQLFSGKIRVAKTLRSLLDLTVGSLRRSSESSGRSGLERNHDASPSFQNRMLDGLRCFDGQVLFVLSGNDVTAKEFEDLTSSNAPWAAALSRSNVVVKRLPDSTHTFSRKEWRDQVENWTLDWMRTW